MSRRPEWWPEGAMGVHGRDYETFTPVFTAGVNDSKSETFHMESDCYHIEESFLTVETLKQVLNSYKWSPCKDCSPPMEELLRLAIQEDGIHPNLLHGKLDKHGLTRTGHPVHFEEVMG